MTRPALNLGLREKKNIDWTNVDIRPILRFSEKCTEGWATGCVLWSVRSSGLRYQLHLITYISDEANISITTRSTGNTMEDLGFLSRLSKQVEAATTEINSLVATA